MLVWRVVVDILQRMLISYKCSCYIIIYLQLNGLGELASSGINLPNVVQSPRHCIWEFTVDKRDD